MACVTDKYHRNNIFNRALVKLTEGLEEKEVAKYLREKLLPGKRYLLKDGMVIESTGPSGQLAIDLLKDMERDPANFRAELSEVIVTNHNKKAVAEWVAAGEGVVHDLSGFKIFKPFILEEWKQQTSNWDFIDAHGPIARVATGGKGQRQILEVLRNTWAVEGLTAALHQAKGLAPIEQQHVYERAARHTALYREEGRTQRKLQNPDAKVAPEWSKKSSLKEAKAARETSQELEKYLDQVKAKAGTEDGKVKGSTLVQKFMIKAGAGYRAIGELLNSKTISGLKVTFKATDMKDPRMVLDPNAENWGLQVARELLIKGIEQRLEELPRTKTAIEALGNPLDSLRLGLRTSEITPGGWKRVLKELKAELPENPKRDAILDKLWQAETKVEPEYVPEPYTEPDFSEQAAVDSYDAYTGYEDLGPSPEFVPPNVVGVVTKPEPIPAVVADISETAHPPVLEPLTGPTEAWVTKGTPVNRAYLEQILNTPGLEDVKNILLATETMKPEVIAKALELYPPEVHQVVAKFMEIWADTRLQFLENFEEALKHIGCKE
jgi:hypothetical protein